jgi:site-specific recombinase XerD
MPVMETSLTVSALDNIQPVVDLVVDGLTSPHSKVAYRKALVDFMAWLVAVGKPGLSKMTVQRYKAVLQGKGFSPSTVNLRLCAIRKLAYEAAENGLVDQTLANGISRVRGVTHHGVRAGNWLTRDQAQNLLNVPDAASLKGARDRAILAVMLGAGLRRSEVAGLTFEHVQQRDGRWVIVDLVGKGNRVRSVPIPSWCKAALDAWSDAALISSGRVFRPVHKGGFVFGDSLTSQAIHDVVKSRAAECGYTLAAHDMRRTFAKLAHKGGSGVDQIQLSLGHASIKTTEKYLGVTQDFTDAPCDRLGLR